MNVRQIEANVEALMGSWSKDTFIYELLLAYGLPKATVTRAMKGTANMSKERGVVQLKSKVLFKPVQGQDLHVSVEHAAKQATHKERFVIVTDFKTLLAKDMSGKATPLETPFEELHKHYAYFLPWAGLEKTEVVNENPADRKAAEKLARLYDDLREANNVESDEQRHALNVFLTRLLFCFFAEDTGIFEDGQFSVGLGSHTSDDGSDSSDYLRRLFSIMGTPESQRYSLPQHLAAFPFVGESLFGDDLPVPDITRKGRSTILAAGDLDWAAINPDIFGSMIQAVVSEENRGELGMHYTSVPNIMKVIGPLFLDELHEEFDKAQGSDTRLRKLLHRIHNLHIFDPACGSGNFLIITYKELRRLEMEILKQFNELPISGIRLDHFHGIEIDDFAFEAAKLSLWLAALQMDDEFYSQFGRLAPRLPLAIDAQITCGNACRMDWNEVVQASGECFLVGNPPYQGAGVLSPSQREDMEICFGSRKACKGLDYISCWFYKAALYCTEINSNFAFVSTNSICQGEQVAVLWPNLFSAGVRIKFAFQSFKWNNLAKGNAGVSVIVIGLGPNAKGSATLFDSEGRRKECRSISPYLIADGSSEVVSARRGPLSFPFEMMSGNRPSDGGHLIIHSEAELGQLANENVPAHWIRRFIGSRELIQGVVRHCLWLSDEDVRKVEQYPTVSERVENCRVTRSSSADSGAKKLAARPHQFRDRREGESTQVVVPSVGSERRNFHPIGIFEKDVVVSNLAFVVQDAPVWMVSTISSTMHMVWLRTVGGRLETRYRYSKDLVYNTFPFPVISKQKQEELAMCALRILEVRERYPDRTLAELYDPDKMPEDLLEAHELNDEAVERCYRARPFESDEDRLQVLFDLYAKMTAEEADKGSLFESSKTKKKRKRHA